MKATLDKGLNYKRQAEGIEVFSDVSFDDEKNEGRYTSGVLLKLFGDTVVWRSYKQSCVALSTTEAEYVAMSETSRDISMVQDMVNKVLGYNMGPAILNGDNTSAIALAKIENAYKLRHTVNIKYHYIKEKVESKDITDKRLTY